jgi:spermidine/putrescine transport system substrate-binding protein
VTQPTDPRQPTTLRRAPGRVTRRELISAGLGSAALLGLSACGVAGTRKANAATDSASRYWRNKHRAGRLDFANYTQYIDVKPGNQSDHPTLDAFEHETGIAVHYYEVIDDDASWFGKIEPSLSANQSIGYDLMVIGSDYYLTDYIAQGFLAPLDHSRLPNFARYCGATFRNSTFDPGNRFTVPWQSGMTGIGYDPRKVGGRITSWQDLLNPALKGKVGMWNDNIQLGNIALLATGVAPESSTPADWRRAAAWLRKQKGAGVVRAYDTSNYLSELERGDLWASLVYSGDIFQANQNGSNLEFVIPREGGLVWTDNLCIPVTAAHPVDALTYMNYVYEPAVAAKIAETVQFVSPVPASRSFIAADAAKATGARQRTLTALSRSPLIFPTAAEESKLHHFRVLKGSEVHEWNGIFEPIYQS